MQNRGSIMISALLPVALVEDLEKASAYRVMSRSEAIRQAVDYWLMQPQLKHLRQPEAEKVAP